MLFDLIILALIGLSIYLGYKKGFIKTISKVLCFIISIIIAKLLHPVISDALCNSPIGDFVNDKVAGKSESVISNDMPSFVQKAGESATNGIADVIITIITILVIMLITFIVANLIINALNLLAKIPVLAQVNKTLGIVAGLLMGIILTYLVMAVVAVINIDASWLDGSFVAESMFENNLLMNLIF